MTSPCLDSPIVSGLPAPRHTRILDAPANPYRMSTRNSLLRSSFEESVTAGGEVIEATIARRLRVTLNPNDSRFENQRALDLVSDARTRLIEILRQAEDGTGPAIYDVRALAARLATWACRDLFDERNPSWRRTRDRLRYFLTRASQRSGYAVWEGADGQELAGLMGWRRDGREPLDRAAVARYLDDPTGLGVGPLPAGSVERLKPAGWDQVLSRMFAHVQRPMSIPQLVRLTHALFAGPTWGAASTLESDDGTDGFDAPVWACQPVGADQLVELKELTAQVWASIRSLSAAGRAVYLLNLPRGDGLFTFVTHGAASLREIGRSLELTTEQYERIWREIPLAERDRRLATNCATADERFALLVAHVPLRDAVIASALGVDEGTVPALRLRAKNTIRRTIGGRLR
jgi:hypothetical protein